MAAATAPVTGTGRGTGRGGGRRRRSLNPADLRRSFTITFVLVVVLAAFLSPLLRSAVVSLKTPDQLSETDSPFLPSLPQRFERDGKQYDVYVVPLPEGDRTLALVKPGRQQSDFIDPAKPDAGTITWEGSWRTLPRAWTLSPAFQNYADVWDLIDFPRLLFNTAAIAVLSTIGAVTSGIVVAYGFARFRFPFKNVLFIVLIATIILPVQVTLVPLYVIFTRIGWNGTWLPLIVPAFFANAYNVFLLRQYFMSLPRDLDEAAMIDGASPFRVLRSIIVPQSVPAIVAVSLFHFFFAWNDFFLPLLYLGSKPELQPLSVGIQQYNALYSTQPTLIQATALMTMAVPVVVFFLAQRAFMRGVVVTGVDK